MALRGSTACMCVGGRRERSTWLVVRDRLEPVGLIRLVQIAIFQQNLAFAPVVATFQQKRGQSSCYGKSMRK